jgi:hypothetical protein
VNKTKINKLKFIILVFCTTIITFLSAYYVSNLLFDGKNSYKVYNTLKQQKIQLQLSIKELQLSNARLQKEYFELKNLEPEDEQK